MISEQFEAGLNPGNALFGDTKIQQLRYIDLEGFGFALHQHSSRRFAYKLIDEVVEFLSLNSHFCGS